MPASATFTFVSPDRYPLANDLSISPECDASQNLLRIIGSKTVVITPNTSATCNYNTGGSSSGGGKADTTPPTNTSVSI